MIVLPQLRKATSLNDLAELLQCKPSTLSYILYKKRDCDKYDEFFIPKKSGGFRKITKPRKNLKRIQTSLGHLLSKCHDEIGAVAGHKGKRQLSHGFRKDYSIITNAMNHTNKRHVFNIDLENFFPSIHFGRVRGFFIKNDHFKLNPIVATIIAQIACHKNELPQGSPCSPVISNLIAHALDIRIANLAKKAKCTYSRYADDLTFSTNQREFPSLIAKLDGDEWVPGKKLRTEIARALFFINPEKTSLQHKHRRQVATGLIINKKVNVRREYYKRARTMCYSLFETGKFYIHGKHEHAAVDATEPEYITGKFDTNVHLEYKDKPTSSVVNIKEVSAEPGPYVQGTVRQLEGILNHIFHVRKAFFDANCSDPKLETEEDLEEKKNDKLESVQENGVDYKQKKQTKKKNKQNKNDEPTGIAKLYKEFLFYKHFFAIERPLVFCEGKTDITYLKCALRQLEGQYDKLIQKKDDKNEFQIKFLSLNKYLRSVFCMAEGCTGLVSLIHLYEKQIERFKGQGKKHPVVILFDNDKGSAAIKNHLKTKYKEYKGEQWNKPFYYLTHNLYVVFTPFDVEGKDTAMESFFTDDILNYKLNNKSFSLDPGVESEFGKAVFAAEVVKANQKSIDFTGFKEVLNRLVAVVEDYNNKIA